MPQPTRDVTARIVAYNAGREPERLALKYRAMRTSAFAFFRGTAHLFWADGRANRTSIPDAPPVWACGDLHFANFGSYRGANGLAYFDVNDFDEATLAPATWELTRFVTSLYVAAPVLALDRSDATGLARSFLSSYRAALATGKAQWAERATATGAVRTLLRQVKRRRLAELIEARTVRRAGQLMLRIDGRRALSLTDDDRERLLPIFHAYFKTHLHARRLRILDIARRIAGIGSLGNARYVLLVREDDSSEKYILVDAKEARKSALEQSNPIGDHVWRSEADRVVELQRRMQAVTPPLLQAATIGRTSFVIRALQPTEDRLLLTTVREHPRLVNDAVQDMAVVTAWAHLRSSGRDGSATADDLIALSRSGAWLRSLITYARRYHRTVENDWRRFLISHEDGVFNSAQARQRK